jgi:hypothetical protein
LPTSAKPSNGSNGSSSAGNLALAENSQDLSGASQQEKKNPANTVGLHQMNLDTISKAICGDFIFNLWFNIFTGDFSWENYREAIRSIPLAGAFCLRAASFRLAVGSAK